MPLPRMLCVLLVVLAPSWCYFPATRAQDRNSETAGANMAQTDLQALAAEAAANRSAPPTPQPVDLQGSSINILELLRQGGAIMLVIGIISLLVVAVAFERLFALRRGKLYPNGLRREVRKASTELGEFQPGLLFGAAERYHSVAARILHDMLQKVGRPVPEVEATIVEATQREADRLYGNVRWLTLAAAVTPLIGLLGTVWGMIIAFHDTTQLGAGSNKAEYLAEGIYIALVTTLGGLAVAIPAAVFAHFFEGRITQMLALIDADLRKLMPRFESQEGRTRYDLSPHGGLVRRDLSSSPTSELHRRSSGPTGTNIGLAELTPPPVRPTSR